MQGKYASSTSLTKQINSQICDFLARPETAWYDVAMAGAGLVRHVDKLLFTLHQSDRDEEVYNSFLDIYSIVKGWPQRSDTDKKKDLDYLHGHIDEFGLWIGERNKGGIRMSYYWSCVSAWMLLVDWCLPPKNQGIISAKLENVAHRARLLADILEKHSLADEGLWQAEYFKGILCELSKKTSIPDPSYQKLKPRRRLSPLAKTIAEPTIQREDKGFEL